MKRYFLVPLAELKHDPNIGHYHWIDLGSHGPAGQGMAAVVVMDGAKAVPAHWQPLPHMLDATGKITAAHAAALADVGVTAEHGGFKAARALAAIHPMFDP
jgi:hypothetical protein